MITTSTRQPRRVVTPRRRWPVGVRLRLVQRESLIDQMVKKGFSNRRLARYADCAPGTIDNLLTGRTQALNKGRTAELICEALGLDVRLYFMPEISSTARQIDQRRKVSA